MAPNVTSSNNEMPKVWYSGHYVAAKQDGNKFYIEVNGVKKEVDKNDLFGMNSWEKLDESFEEQIDKNAILKECKVLGLQISSLNKLATIKKQEELALVKATKEEESFGQKLKRTIKKFKKIK